MAKYADDATLLAPEKTDVQIQDESNSITKWAADNKLTINLSKTRELRTQKLHTTNRNQWYRKSISCKVARGLVAG